MKTTPVKGTRDILPQEARIRDYVQSEILRVYRSAGFERIGTPALEDLDNLRGSEGGENLGLIYAVMKRGEKLQRALREGTDLADLGLRYDLTLPLARFYACNRAKLMTPFKVIQIDKAYRAEQPQQGRLREFYQCDIDILGDPGVNAECELIAVTAKALLALGMRGFTVRVNDRRMLDALLAYAGFAPEERGAACVALDKLDKVGADGVRAELQGRGFDRERADALLDALHGATADLDAAERYCGAEACASVKEIVRVADQLSDGRYRVVPDLTLVRGQGYYTGPVFEIAADGYSGSVAGGGRYDHMVGKFCGQDVPAVGFSIGFERICAILLESGYKIPDARPRAAILYGGDFAEAQAFAESLRDRYDVTLFALPKKLGPMIERLKANGYTGLCVMGRDDTVRDI